MNLTQQLEYRGLRFSATIQPLDLNSNSELQGLLPEHKQLMSELLTQVLNELIECLRPQANGKLD